MDASSKWSRAVYPAIFAALVIFTLLQSGFLVVFGKVLSIEAEVISVAKGAAGEREALVRLNLGPVVRATIPLACLVFPGQVATVSYTGPLIGAQPAFLLWESRDRP
jgi:hypothetical protein